MLSIYLGIYVLSKADNREESVELAYAASKMIV